MEDFDDSISRPRSRNSHYEGSYDYPRHRDRYRDRNDDYRRREEYEYYKRDRDRWNRDQFSSSLYAPPTRGIQDAQQCLFFGQSQHFFIHNFFIQVLLKIFMVTVHHKGEELVEKFLHI